MRQDKASLQHDRCLRRLLEVWDIVSGMPFVAAVHGEDYIPETMGSYHNLPEHREVGAVHWFSEDYKIERIWNRPEHYAKRLAELGYITIGPDFSLFIDDPPPLQRWNVYRSRLLTAYWQREGVRAVPLCRWSDERSWSFAYEGLPVGSVLAVSMLGMAKDEYLHRLFWQGYTEMVVRLEPEAVLIYTMAEPPAWLIELAPCRLYNPPNLNRRRGQTDPAQLHIVGG